MTKPKLLLLPGLFLMALLMQWAVPESPALAQDPGQTPTPTPSPAPAPATPGGSDGNSGNQDISPAQAGEKRAPSPTLDLDLRYWRPLINLHFSSTSTPVGEPVTLTLSANNSSRLPPLRLLLLFQVPSGMALSGDSLERQECTGQCSALFDVPTGTTKEFQLQVVATETGSFEVEGFAEWSFPDPQGMAVPDAGTITVSDRLRVTPPSTPTPTEGPPEQSTVPRIYVSSPKTVLSAGESVTVSADLSNPLFSPGQMEATIRVAVPAGWEVWGSDFGAGCSATCVGNFVVLPGGARTVLISMRPHQVGNHRVQVEADWRIQGGDGAAQGSQELLEFTVLPSPESPAPAPPATDPPAPPALLTSPPRNLQSEPPASGGGCSAAAGSADLSLPLVFLGLAMLSLRRRIQPR